MSTALDHCTIVESRCVNENQKLKSNVNYNTAKDTSEQVITAPAGPPVNLLDASIDAAWFAAPSYFKDHALALCNLQQKADKAPGNGGAYGTARRVRSVFQEPVRVRQPDPGAEWPMFSEEPPPLPPPW